MTWSPAGEAGWRIVVGGDAAPDPAVARRARAIATAVAAARVPGVTGAHAGLRSVLVRFDAVAVNPAAVRGALEAVVAAATAVPAAAGTVRRFALCVCPACAPDHAWIAARLGAPWREVAGRFCAAPLEVLVTGFLPGFPYLGPLPPEFHLPRLESPRTRVPAGSVGIGGMHAGIYPFASPGGWRLLGRIAEVLFDPARGTPALCAPGDLIAFAPTDDHAAVHDAPR